MIKTIKIKFGPKGNESDPVSFDPEHTTIFVGPNNGGKSLILREIEGFFSSYGTTEHGKSKIIQDIEVVFPSYEEFMEKLNQVKLSSTTQEDTVIVGKFSASNCDTNEVLLPNLKTWLESKTENQKTKLYRLLLIFVHKLDAITRLTLVSNKDNHDLERPPQNTLGELFVNDTKRFEVRRIIKESLDGKIFVIDPTGRDTLRIRFANNEPPAPHIEQGLSQEARAYHLSATKIEECSDGVKAFTGLIMAAIASYGEVLLIDEPEAFLHPALAYKLGQELVSVMTQRNGHLFVATHSSKFLTGCIESGKQTNVIRLTYDGKKPTARHLPSKELRQLMHNPLLRSTGVLDALFYNAVVITEADADRAFYQEINGRLLTYKPEWGVKDCLFINAHGKQEIPMILEPLRRMGIPAVGIVDIDVIKRGGKEWSALLQACNIPEVTRKSLETARAAIYKKFEDINASSDKDMKRDGGINLLTGDNRDACQNLMDSLADYGVFIVSIGEIEQWLRSLNVSREKQNWLRSIFEKLGHDPNDDGYVKPSDGDVWEFMSKIKSWLLNPNRKGIN